MPKPGQYSLEPGILQPLFFTAIKYRHSAWRRNAIQLLRKVGREGPWDGSLLAVVAARATKVEERDLKLLGLTQILPENISERDRLHGCAMDAEDSDSRVANSVVVMFSGYVQQMVKCGAYGLGHCSLG